MRWLALLPCAVLALVGCTSTPLDEPVMDDGTTSPPVRPAPEAPLGVADGDFRAIPAYPAGPYGSQRGAIIANHTFLGWRDPVQAGFDAARLEEVSLSDFHDPEGARTELIVVNASAVWCPVCRTEMANIDQRNLTAR
jgi:hypothetical protein